MNNIQTKPTRLWFLSKGYQQADTRYTNGHVLWLHPKTNDVLNQYGRKLVLQLVPKEKFLKTNALYLKLSRTYNHMYLARLKYLTFKGDIPKGYTIDHIDGNTLNNDIRNLRTVTPAINRRDGGFMRKLRHKGIDVAKYPGIILEGYERMARWREEHTDWEYRCLDHDMLLQIFVGPLFQVVSAQEIEDLDFKHHPEY